MAGQAPRHARQLGALEQAVGINIGDIALEGNLIIPAGATGLVLYRFDIGLLKARSRRHASF
jgi:hypothetical protein